MALTDKQRPLPPLSLNEGDAIRFEPARELIEWVRATFIAEDATLRNEDHHQLNSAVPAALWTDVPNGRAGQRVVGQCEMGIPPAGKWLAAGSSVSFWRCALPAYGAVVVCRLAAVGSRSRTWTPCLARNKFVSGFSTRGCAAIPTTTQTPTTTGMTAICGIEATSVW